MLEIHDNTIDVTLDATKLKNKTEAYLVETVAQRLTDLFLARHGEEILAKIDRETIEQKVHEHVTTTLAEEGTRVLRRD